MSHTIDYNVDKYIKNGVKIADSFDGAGYLNAGRGVRPLPDLKGRAFVEYGWGNQNALLYLNHITSYEDERGTDFGRTVDSQTTYDFHYQLFFLNQAAKVTFSAINLTDEDPPLARVGLNYDGYTHNAFGRMLKLGFQYTID